MPNSSLSWLRAGFGSGEKKRRNFSPSSPWDGLVPWPDPLWLYSPRLAPCSSPSPAACPCVSCSVRLRAPRRPHTPQTHSPDPENGGEGGGRCPFCQGRNLGSLLLPASGEDFLSWLRGLSLSPGRKGEIWGQGEGSWPGDGVADRGAGPHKPHNQPPAGKPQVATSSPVLAQPQHCHPRRDFGVQGCQLPPPASGVSEPQPKAGNVLEGGSEHGPNVQTPSLVFPTPSLSWGGETSS